MLRRVRCAALALAAGLLAGPAHAETVSFAVDDSGGTTTALTAKLDRPVGAGPFPAVVLLHGCNGMWKPWGDRWADRLVRWGYVALQVDSFKPRGFPRGVCGRGSAVGSTTRALDAHAGKTYLTERPFVDPNRIAVMGMSHGGWSTLAAVENTLVVDEPRANPFKAAVALYPSCAAQLYRLDAPLLILIGENDDWTFAKSCERMRLVGPTAHAVTLKVYPEATHSFDVDRPEREYLGHHMKYDAAATGDAVARVKAFLARHLQ